MAKNERGKGYMSSEDRKAHPLCNAKTRNGKPCQAFAGLGTDHPGIGPCKYHGGSTRNHVKRAIVLKAQQEAATLGHAIPVTPDQALKGALRASAGHTAWLAAEIAALDGVGSVENRALVQLYGEERDRLARTAKACIDSGMTRREVQFAQEATATLAKAIESAFAGIEGITAAHRKRFGQLLRLELQQLQQASPEPEAVEN